jgi:uncharacterized membrane protein YdjX (TVP38/TMEM64 family)
LPPPQIHDPRVRYAIFAIWLIIVAGALYLYFFQRDLVEAQLKSALSTSTFIAATIYLLLGSLRAFTLVPATFLVVIAMPFFPPWLLFLITLPIIGISSGLIYGFAEILHMDEDFERKYPKQIRKLKDLLQRHQLPIIIGWSFLLFLPTDCLCYVCGTLRINFTKFIMGVLIGEGTVYGVYIYFGDRVLRGEL